MQKISTSILAHAQSFTLKMNGKFRACVKLTSDGCMEIFFARFPKTAVGSLQTSFTHVQVPILVTRQHLGGHGGRGKGEILSCSPLPIAERRVSFASPLLLPHTGVKSYFFTYKASKYALLPVFQGVIWVYGITIKFTGFPASFSGSLWLVSLFLWKNFPKIVHNVRSCCQV